MANKGLTSERIYADFRQAASLLRDKNLVWSADLDSIREDLAEYIETKASLGIANNSHLVAVVQRLIADENDLAVD
jgi:hypothetical protein